MSAIKKKLNNNFLFGCIKYMNKHKLYLMPIAYWILNYKKYDPAYDPKEWEFEFRRNVLNVTDEHVSEYMRAVEVDRIDLDQFLSEFNSSTRDEVNIFFFIDFDKKLLVSSFSDIEVEEYLPDDSWQGVFDNPIIYLPDKLQAIFG